MIATAKNPLKAIQRKLGRLAMLAAFPALVAVAPPPGLSAPDFAVIERAVEANAAKSAPIVVMPFQSPGLSGMVQLRAADAAGNCRAFTVSAVVSGVDRRYDGSVCRNSQAGWSIQQIGPAPTAAAKPPLFASGAKPSVALTNQYAYLQHQQLLAQQQQAYVQQQQQQYAYLLKQEQAQLQAQTEQYHSAAPSGGAAPLQPQGAAGPPPSPPPAAAATAPSAAATAPAAAAAALGPIDAEKAQMEGAVQDVPLTYKKPDTLSFDAATPISLIAEVLGKGTGKAALKDLPGNPVEVVAKLSPLVTAQLRGDPNAVQITARVDETQSLTPLANVQWTWDVLAKQPGPTTLTLTVFAHFKTGTDPSDSHMMASYTTKFPVQISWLSWLKYEISVIDPIWKWLGLGTPVAIIGGLWAFFRRKKSS